MAQKRNDEMVDLLGQEFLYRVETATAWMSMIPMGLNLPRLRGLWAFGSVYAGDTYDHSGQGRTVVDVGTVSYGYHGVKPYAEIDGTNGNYLRRADEAALDLTDEITMYSWFYPDTIPAKDAIYFNKWNNGAVAGRSYALAMNTLGQCEFRIRDNTGVEQTVANTEAGAIPAAQWIFNAGTVDMSVGDIEVFSSKYESGKRRLYQTSSAAGAMNNLQNSASDLRLFNDSGNASPLDGKIGYVALYAKKHTNAMIIAFYQFTKSLFGV